jgi:hypothetical protein
MESTTDSQRWHELLTTRCVCEICLTRFFVQHHMCPACHRIGHIRPLVSMLLSVAQDDEDLRNLIAHGQAVAPNEAQGGNASH